jgi:hypothetical protein
MACDLCSSDSFVRSVILAGAGYHHELVDVAPDPVLPRLKGLNYRVLRGVEVLCGVAVRARIATTHMAADQTLPEVYPSVTRL